MNVFLDVPYFKQQTDYTCAPACLRMALAFRFPDNLVSEAELAERCLSDEIIGTAVEDAYRTARDYNLDSWLEDTRIETEVEAALQAGCPVIANVQFRALPYYPLDDDNYQPPFWHSVVLVGIDDQYVYVHDPDPDWGRPRQEIKYTDFFSGWDLHPYSAYRL